jgi:hypothetical protein
VDLTVEPLTDGTSRLTIAVDFEGHGIGKILVPLLPGKRAAAVPGAWVRDWDKLLGGGSVYLTGGDRRLLEVAASYARGGRWICGPAAAAWAPLTPGG